MNTFENLTFNPRTSNGGAYDLMGSIPSHYHQQHQQPSMQGGAQLPFQQFQQPGFQTSPTMPFQGQPMWQQQAAYQHPFTPPYNVPISVAGQAFSPWQAPQGPFAQYGIPQQAQYGMPQQTVAPVVTTRAAELKIKIPVHRIIGRNPQEVHQYLAQVVLPILLDGLAKRAISNELGLTLTSDLRGECVAEIYI